MLDGLGEAISVQAYFTLATVATLLLVGGWLLEGLVGPWSFSLRQSPRLAGSLAVLAVAGWVGLLAKHNLEADGSTALRWAAASGLFLIVLLPMPGRFRRRAWRAPPELLGQHAEVYRRIPATGQGLVRVTHRGQQRLVAAASTSGEVPAFADVAVVAIQDDGCLLVRALKPVAVTPTQATSPAGPSSDAAGPSSGTPHADRPGA
jgi:hypothetical protein